MLGTGGALIIQENNWRPFASTNCQSCLAGAIQAGRGPSVISGKHCEVQISRWFNYFKKERAELNSGCLLFQSTAGV